MPRARENDNTELMRTLRQQAWHRAKGELHAMLATFWGEREEFEKLHAAVTEFTKNVDDNGLAE